MLRTRYINDKALTVGLSRHTRLALLASCVLAAGVFGFSSTAALAGCNSGDVGNASLLSSAACAATATATDATAVGLNAEAGTASTAIGRGAYARGINATSVGSFAGPGALVDGATNVGANAGFNGVGLYSTAIGAGNSATTASQATGQYSVAIGGGDGTTFNPSVGPAILLNGAQATGSISTAIGAASLASGGGSSAFGLYSRATANHSAAFGEFSTAGGPNSIAVGLFSDASGTSSIAIGRNTSAGKNGSVAIGDGSVTNVSNSVSFGSSVIKRRIINIAPASGLNDAVNLAQVKALIAAAVAGAPAVSVGSGETRDALLAADEIRRELSELRALVKEQQQRIAMLESRKIASVPAE